MPQFSTDKKLGYVRYVMPRLHQFFSRNSMNITSNRQPHPTHIFHHCVRRPYGDGSFRFWTQHLYCQHFVLQPLVVQQASTIFVRVPKHRSLFASRTALRLFPSLFHIIPLGKRAYTRKKPRFKRNSTFAAGVEIHIRI